eukprot:CAMPEP_0114539464 /NCGR_PEP_ID=MMETSP0114-20121206/250_1 /TAXON_ID=31324 /ORGANISM="Goniomonas sp, Strain m" /LENGTH=279 /DNA_ID=CAMNT_0001723565 /DNA_START=73 /DNA_END=912 /DNA_ORIENTATION=-
MHVKKTEDLQFLYETSVNNSVDDVFTDVLFVWNSIITLRRLIDSVEALAAHGPAKHPQNQGLDEYDESPPPRGQYYKSDPTGRRTGEAPEPRLAEVLFRQCAEARKLTNCKEQVERKEFMTRARITEAMDHMRGAITIAYPEGLPEWDDARTGLDGEFEADSRIAEMLEPSEATMWFAGKQFMKGQKLSDTVGKNEKTKIVVKLQKSGAGAPVREPVVDEKTQKEMMAFYFKKQEEMKKLEEEADDAYLDSAWANPKAMKAALQGTGDIGWKAGGRRMF